jgi:hypothetical protein
MKDEASLYNEYVHKLLYELHDALLHLVGEEYLTLRRAWKTLPPREDDDGFVETPAEIRSGILELLPIVKEQIEAAAAGAVK